METKNHIEIKCVYHNDGLPDKEITIRIYHSKDIINIDSRFIEGLAESIDEFINKSKNKNA